MFSCFGFGLFDLTQLSLPAWILFAQDGRRLQATRWKLCSADRGFLSS